MILVESSDHVTTITLNRPDRLNAIDGELVEALREALEAAASDPAVRVVVLTGAGRGFCAGGDLKAMAERERAAATVAESIAEMRGLHRTTELLRGMPKPTIAAVNGPCAGAGLSWACAADLRYAAASAVFTTAFARAGQTGDYGGTWLLPRLVGETRARELYLLAERIGAAEAERIGLVNAVVADDALHAHVAAVAARLAAAAPLALAGIKANLNDAGQVSLPALLDLEAERQVLNRGTRDVAEAARAFAEGREPRFEGR